MRSLYDMSDAEFDEAVRGAGRHAIEETLAAGFPVCYQDRNGLEVMQQPDGRIFEIRWIPGAPSGHNYEILRELTPHTS